MEKLERLTTRFQHQVLRQGMRQHAFVARVNSVDNNSIRIGGEEISEFGFNMCQHSLVAEALEQYFINELKSFILSGENAKY